MKLRWEYNISKQFQSISCLNVWLRAHVPPSNIFDTKKPDFTLFHDFSASQPSSFARNEQNITLQLRQNSSETDLVTRTHQNMPKIGCFGAFSHFFLFLRYVFWELWAHNLLFNSSNLGRNIPNDWYMPQVYIKRNFQIWPKNEIVLPPKHGGGWGGQRRFEKCKKTA